MRVCHVQFLGMSRPSSVKRGFLRRLLRDVEGHGDAKLEAAGYDRLLGDPDYVQLKALTSLDVHQMLKRYRSRLHHSLDQAHAGAQVKLDLYQGSFYLPSSV